MAFQRQQPAEQFWKSIPRLKETIPVMGNSADNFKKFWPDKDSVYSKEIKVADIFWPIQNDFAAVNKVKHHRCGGCS